MKYDINLSPCLNRYSIDLQNILFFFIVLIGFFYIIVSRSDNQKIISANFFKPFYFINVKDDKFVYFLFFYHIFFTIIRVFSSECKEINDVFSIAPDDTYSFYLNAGVFFEHVKLQTGSNIISYLISPFVTILKISYFNMNLFFSIIGFYGIFKFYQITKEYINGNQMSIFLLILLLILPNFHYWTATISKDVIIFFFLSSYLSTAFSIKKDNALNYYLFIFFLISILIRPYFAIIFVFSYLISYLIVKADYKINLIYILFAAILVYIFFKISLHIYPDIARQGATFFEILSNYFDKRLMSTSTGYAFDYRETNYFTRFVSYFFSPISISNLGPKNIFATVNNLTQLCIFLFLSINILINHRYLKKALSLIFIFTNNKVQKLCLFIFLIVILFLYSNTISNYGIIMRQKETIIFLLFFYLIIIYSKISYLKNHD